MYKHFIALVSICCRCSVLLFYIYTCLYPFAIKFEEQELLGFYFIISIIIVVITNTFTIIIGILFLFSFFHGVSLTTTSDSGKESDEP